jgi:endoglucanase
MKLSPLLLVLIANLAYSQQSIIINDKDYFEMPGLNVMVFSDFYPEGHQSGVTIIQHGTRVAANGDLRLEPSPGQWSPVPGKGKRTVSKETNTIVQQLWYPDSSRNRRGFNPIDYPDLKFAYWIKVTALDNNSIRVIVDLEKPLPAEWIGKVGFNLELFPGDLFGKTYLMDDGGGIFPMQAEGPVEKYWGEYLTAPLATGKKLVIAPEIDKQRIGIESKTGSLELWDGRSNHNNGWFIVRSSVPAGATKSAIEWIITPNVIPGWKYGPVIHVSQVGYHPDQPKKAVIEFDKSDNSQLKVEICRILGTGPAVVKSGQPEEWGSFLRYNYKTFDFTDIREPGMYIINCGSASSEPFKISDDVLERDVWQPVLDYFLPVQMCHMRVNDHYRVWHDWCHLDDALMAPLNHNHFDGYYQGPATLTDFKPFDPVPGLNRGGWHDAGDYDLRVESQMGTVWMLALMIEEFGLDYDATTIDQEKQIVEIHVPDGKSDAIQQIEHGLASVLGGYRSLGRLYRGIICQDLRQYVLEGDGSAMTDNLVYDSSLKPGEVTALKSGAVEEIRSGNNDDRLVFTEDNPYRELYVAGGLAAASRVLKELNPELSKECLETALKLYENSTNSMSQSPQDAARQNPRGSSRLAGQKIIALSELILTTNHEDLKKELLSMQNDIVRDIARSGWAVARVINLFQDKTFQDAVTAAVAAYQSDLGIEREKSPFGVPYRPDIWGAGWNIQKFGVDQYFFRKGWPDLVPEESYINALNFVLGVHPGENTASFASGIGSKSLTVAYGVNRAEWSYIPGGVASGTALIRPDLPELKIWPFFWQQTEYVMGGGSENFMFLVLAVDKFYNGK